MRTTLLAVLFFLCAAALIPAPVQAATKKAATVKKTPAAKTTRAGTAKTAKTAKAADPDTRPTTTTTSLALFQAGDAYRRAGNFDKAEEYFKQAWAREKGKPTLDPVTTRRLIVFVGLAYQNAMDFEQASQLFKQSTLKDPQYPLFHYFLATSLAYLDQAPKGEKNAAAGTGKNAPVKAGANAAETAETQRNHQPPDSIFQELALAYKTREYLNPGERIPNPRTDIFLSPLRHDPRFEAALAGAGPAAQPELEADIEEMVRSGEDVSPDMQQAIAEEVESQPAQAAELLLRRIADPAQNDKQRAATLWALGYTGDPRAADAMIHVLYQPQMVPLKGVILEALSRIGGPKAGDALVLELRDAKDENDRFQLLTLLARMQYDAALPLMLDLLHMDTEQAANQMLFCFGKMGDKAVPPLLTKTFDPDKTVRINAINMLRWVGSSRAMIPLQKQYGLEQDPEVRLAILGALDTVMRPDQFEVFLKTTLAAEKDREARSVMIEKQGEAPRKKGAFDSFKAAKVNDRALWKIAFDTLFRSNGRAGSLDDLAHASTVEDEPELQRLRARILDRQSAQCFSDYMKINQIIAFNKMLGN